MIDSIIIASYLAITLFIGIYAGRGIKTMRDFAIASKTYSTPIMVATISATLIGGESILGLSEEMYKYGIIYLVICIGFVLNSFIIAFFLSPHIVKFDYAISVGDIMHKHYGKFGRILTGAAGMVLAAGYIGGQISGMGFIFHSFFGLPHVYGIILGLGIVILYSSFGGIRAVTATDVIQFVILIVAVPMVCNVGLDMVGGFGQLIEKIPSSHLTLSPSGETPWHFVALFFLFLIPDLDPAFTQRVLMAKDVKQARNSMLITGCMELIFFILVMVISFTVLVMKPDLDPHLVVNYLIDTVLPTGIKGFVVAGMLAIIMSTADSYLNVAGISFVHDVVRPLRQTKLADKYELRLTRVSTLIIGVIALYGAINLESVMEIVLNFISFWALVIVVPLYAVIFNFKVDKRSIIACFMAYIITLFSWKYIIPIYNIDIDIHMPGMIISLITFISSNYYFSKNKLQTV
jgi:solute:Na+ symporter, SSS family